MSSFTLPLELEYVDGNAWLVTAPFHYELGDKGSNRAVCVPEGFSTDFASVPRILWNIFCPTGKYGKAAVIHDFLYRGGFVQRVEFRENTGYYIHEDVNRKESDAIFLEAMGVLGVGWFTRWTLYLGVRVGGHFSWKER